MRPLLLLASAIALATPSLAQTANPLPAPVEIVNLEQHLWTTMAEGDFATVRSLFTKDFIDNWIELKKKEYDSLRLRPHPYEFYMYFYL